MWNDLLKEREAKLNKEFEWYRKAVLRKHMRLVIVILKWKYWVYSCFPSSCGWLLWCTHAWKEGLLRIGILLGNVEEERDQRVKVNARNLHGKKKATSKKVGRECEWGSIEEYVDVCGVCVCPCEVGSVRSCRSSKGSFFYSRWKICSRSLKYGRYFFKSSMSAVFMGYKTWRRHEKLSEPENFGSQWVEFLKSRFCEN